ncbi:hypothetical protein LDENG_00284550 [Lucifuga dentata]|nr:hypothetical protein LDENG_00284550 [Lucifuga dentata]
MRHRKFKEEFRRITIRLERTFVAKLDCYTPKLLDIIGSQGGVVGTKIRSLLASLSQRQHLKDKMVILMESSDGIHWRVWRGAY